eukprot:5555896-Prymnesium_polylepis.1
MGVISCAFWGTSYYYNLHRNAWSVPPRTGGSIYVDTCPKRLVSPGPLVWKPRVSPRSPQSARLNFG